MEKVCSRCGRSRDERKFPKSIGGGRRNYCFSCRARYETARLRLDMYENLGDRCACCGETHPQFLTLEHILGVEGERKPWWQELRQARREGWPRDKYEVLCFNCNCAKGHWGDCPHRTGETREQYFSDLREIVSIRGKRNRFFQEKIHDPNFREKRPWKSGEMRGNKFAATKLDENGVKRIKELRAEGLTHRSIARELGVSRQLIGLILQGKRW